MVVYGGNWNHHLGAFSMASKLACDFQITNVEVECDSAALVNLIENGATEFHL